MSDAVTNHQGNFVWYEMMTKDPARAQAFYTEVVGWTASAAGMGGGDYTLFSQDGVPVAGMMPMPEQAEAAGAAPGWRGFISVANADETAARIKAAGGTLRFGPEDIQGVGRIASMTDPQGVPFLLITPAGQPNPLPAPGTPGTIGWHELSALDGPTAFDFYAGFFGWTAGEATDMGAHGKYQTFDIKGVSQGGILTRFLPDQPPRWLFYINTPSIDAAIERTKAAGGKVLIGPQIVPGGSWIMQGLDTTAAMFAMVAPKR